MIDNNSLKGVVLFQLCLILFASSLVAQPINLQDGLVGLYRFEESGVDSSGLQNDAEIFGASFIADRFSRSRHAVHLDGIDDFVKFPTSLELFGGDNNGWSYAAFFKPTEGGSTYIRPILADYNDTDFDNYDTKMAVMLLLSNSNEIWASIRGYNYMLTVNSNHYASTGEWNFACVVVDKEQSKILLYVNNFPPQEASFNFGPSYIEDQPLRAGANFQMGTEDQFYGGFIDDIWLYNRPLTRCEVLAIYYEGKEGRLNFNPFTEEQVSIPCNETVLLDAGPGYCSYLWQDGSRTQTVTASAGNTYYVEVIDPEGIGRDTIEVVSSSHEIKSLDFPDTLNLCIDDAYVFDLSNYSEAYNVQWNDGDQSAKRVIKNPGFYSVDLIDKCVFFSDSVQVVEKLDLEPLPNVITPNNDQHNQAFILPENLSGASLEIYNRWGNRVYLSRDYKNDWNGEALPSGVYFYHISHKCLDHSLKGTISIIRS